jgi:hypothetical protein
MPTASPAVQYRLKVSLRHISPMVWRRLVVPSDLTLYGLHRAIQIAVGWEDYHLHAFKVHGRYYGTEWTGQRHHVEDGDELREVTLADLSLRLRQKILYEYDFGDFWEHEVRVEARELADPKKPFPVCVGGARAGPPEDVGGPDGYDRLLERLHDLRLRLLFDALAPAGEDDGGKEDEFEDDEEDAWALACSYGFDGDDDPLLRYDPAAFDRRTVNAELRREFAPASSSAPATGGADAS